METLQIFVFALVGVFVALLQERVGAFQNLSPALKQISNGVLSFVLPVALSWSAGWWKPEFGDSSEVITQLFYLLVPVAVWVITQATHHIDRLAQLVGDKIKK